MKILYETNDILVDCVEYDDFLEELKVIIDKVDSNDLTDFEDF